MRAKHNSARIASREIRISAGRMRLAHQGAAVSCAGEFAQAILRRYNRRQVLFPMLSLVLRNAWLRFSRQDVHHHTHVRWQARLTLRLPRWEPRLALSQSHHEPLLAPGRSRWEPRMPLNLSPRSHLCVDNRQTAALPAFNASPRALASATEQFVSPIFARRKRIETGIAASTGRAAPRLDESPPGPWVPDHAALPVPKVVRRGVETSASAALTPLAQSGVESSPRQAAHTPASEQRSYASARQPNAPPEAVDVKLLTDQVIQAIDRRIIAERERLGRI